MDPLKSGEIRPVAVLLTGHFYKQKRRGSMHWLADELVQLGWDVRFVTVGYSWLSYLLRDKRLRALDRAPTRGYEQIGSNLAADYRLTPFHPLSSRSSFGDRLLAPLMRTYPWLCRSRLKRLVSDAGLVVLESGIPVLLAPTVRRLTKAKIVYRVNDDVRLLGLPPLVAEAESQCAASVDHISLASPVLAERFARTGKVQLDPMGLDTRQFQSSQADPYIPRWEKEVVCAGTTQFDLNAVLALADARPSWRFTIIGRWNQPVERSNIVWMGETPFHQVVPFVQHADIGLAPYVERPGVEYQTHHSNRLQQYTFLKLPVLAPERMTHPSMPHLLSYGQCSPLECERVLKIAADFDRSTVNIHVPGWDYMASRIADTANSTPPSERRS